MWEQEDQILALRDAVAKQHSQIDGLVHAIAFADYEGGMKPFHETGKSQFLRAMDVSCYSLVALANALRDLLTERASVVTISISTTKMASENYGFMAPIKAALDSSLAFLAKSFSKFSQIRFNAVGPGIVENIRLGRHPGLCGLVPIRGKGDSAWQGGADDRGGERGRVFAQPSFQWHQRANHRGRCRDVDQLL